MIARFPWILAVGLNLLATTGPLVAHHSFAIEFDEKKPLGHLDIEVTVDDPKAYTAPWTFTLNQFIVLNTELIDYHCAENERDTAHFLGK